MQPFISYLSPWNTERKTEEETQRAELHFPLRMNRDTAAVQRYPTPPQLKVLISTGKQQKEKDNKTELVLRPFLDVFWTPAPPKYILHNLTR